MTIRTAERADKAPFLALLIELKRSGYQEMGVPFSGIEVTDESERLFDECLAKETVHLLVAENEQKIVGVCVAYESPNIIEGRNRMVIEEMVVEPGNRGQKIGSMLLEAIEAVAQQRGVKHIKVATGTKLKANQFYQKQGYVYFENTYRKEIPSYIVKTN